MSFLVGITGDIGSGKTTVSNTKIKKTNRRIIAISLAILIVFGILFTTSRNGLLGLLIGITIFLIPLRRKIFITGFLSLISVFIINYLSKLIFNEIERSSIFFSDLSLIHI